ncbi:hypothetical protein [Pseudogulbenkiania subflava]|uniref:Uncharacterized protein n=1 Tax=Pseudogulbenkiania subflava DSM 22618 TaxID=1123014 RepID=A0A1Y6BWV5_9NEIS|nr:hypothetical protein [Pseudogulbenkiania subflava]SMF22302.1 hypothetical protein SAMN02745746_01963 [Pseudogulbenkiania subflava DSM 22618]
MREYRFKILQEGDFLCGLSEKEMIIRNANGDYHIHKLCGLDGGKPSFFKSFEVVAIHDIEDASEKVTLIKFGEEYRAYKIIGIREGFPTFDESFCIVVKRGIGKIEVYDSETDLTITLPAMEGE